MPKVKRVALYFFLKVSSFYWLVSELCRKVFQKMECDTFFTWHLKKTLTLPCGDGRDELRE